MLNDYHYRRHFYHADHDSKRIRCLRRVRKYQRGNQNPQVEKRQTTQWPKEKGHSYNTPHRNLKIEQREPNQNSCALEGLGIPAPLVTPVLLLLKVTNII